MENADIKAKAQRWVNLKAQLDAIKEEFEPLGKELIGVGEFHEGGVHISVEIVRYEERKGASAVKLVSEEIYKKMRALGLIYTNERRSLKVKV